MLRRRSFPNKLWNKFQSRKVASIKWQLILESKDENKNDKCAYLNEVHSILKGNKI